MQKYTVTATNGLNVRHQPQVNDNKVGYLLDGTVIEVKTDVEETEADGWVWRRLHLPASGEYWVAEFNKNTGIRLMEPITVERLRVVASRLNIRREPKLSSEMVGMLSQDSKIEVHATDKIRTETGWIWRQLADSGHWIAEHNEESDQVLAAPLPTKSVVLGRVKVVNTGFMLDTKPFRFIGGNVREFAFYPHHLLSPATEAHQTQQLQAMRDELGMEVVRMHAAHADIPPGESIRLVSDALDKIHASGLVAIVVLNDSLGDRPFYVHGEKAFHTEDLGHLNKRYFHDKAYENTYIPYIQKLVTALQEHPGIFSWELGNEYAIHPQDATDRDAEAFMAFVQRSASLIRSIDPNHLITIGLLNTGQIKPAEQARSQFAIDVYSEPDIDFGTVHFYQGQDIEEARGMIDLKALQLLDKPLIVEECGSTVDHHDRVGYISKRLTTWFDEGAVGFVQWGVSVTGTDIGVGDNRHGLDNYSTANAPLYDTFKALYSRWAHQELA